MRLLDLFCGAGGASMGYHRAGFEVVGVDIKPQPRYPFTFIQMDAFEFMERYFNGGWGEFDSIHASPPCQRFSVSTNRKEIHPDCITPIRGFLDSSEKPYIIENVIGAPLNSPFTLCGSMFGLEDDGYGLARHRNFESKPIFILGSNCTCRQLKNLQITGHLATKKDNFSLRHRKPSLERAKRLMGIDWMKEPELVEAIPPAYTEFIGKQLMKYLLREVRRSDCFPEKDTKILH